MIHNFQVMKQLIFGEVTFLFDEATPHLFGFTRCHNKEPYMRGVINMIYGYARVSTRGQARDGNSLEVQEKQLRDAGAEIVYSDAFTGTKTERPELTALMERIQSGDTLIVCKLDRLARSAVQGIELIEDLLGRNVTVNVLNMGTLDNTPTGRLIRQVMLAFAQFERDMIVTRTQEGKAVAKQRDDFREGRPPKYGRAQKEHALELLKTHSYRQVEEMTGISKSTIIRYRQHNI